MVLNEDGVPSEERALLNHDEAFKKLLQTFFKEFIQLFFPELDRQLDHNQTRFLMQELLVDIVGEKSRTLDLLLETKYKAWDAYILIHFEPQSYREVDFHERMFIYFSRLFERHRKEHKLIIPIAIFTSDDAKDEADTFELSIPEFSILHFQFLKVELRNNDWRKFIESDNPVAAALLSKMGYNREERRELRLEYLRMLLRLRKQLDDARMSLIMSIADLYYEPKIEEDLELMKQLSENFSEEGVEVMELMPAWKKWGYDEGLVEGMEKGLEKGIEEGIEKGIEEGIEMGKEDVLRKLLDKGFPPESVAEAIGISVDEIRRLKKD